jgi:hypothetical protein
MVTLGKTMEILEVIVIVDGLEPGFQLARSQQLAPSNNQGFMYFIVSRRCFTGHSAFVSWRVLPFLFALELQLHIIQRKEIHFDVDLPVACGTWSWVRIKWISEASWLLLCVWARLLRDGVLVGSVAGLPVG